MAITKLKVFTHLKLPNSGEEFTGKVYTQYNLYYTEKYKENKVIHHHSIFYLDQVRPINRGFYNYNFKNQNYSKIYIQNMIITDFFYSLKKQA